MHGFLIGMFNNSVAVDPSRGALQFLLLMGISIVDLVILCTFAAVRVVQHESH